MWYAKMYFSENREIFQYDSLGMQGVPDVQREFPIVKDTTPNITNSRLNNIP